MQTSLLFSVSRSASSRILLFTSKKGFGVSSAHRCIRFNQVNSSTSSSLTSLKRDLTSSPKTENSPLVQRQFQQSQPLQSSASALLLAALTVGLVYSAYYSYHKTSPKPTSHSEPLQDITPEDLTAMASELAAGRPGNLTSEQEEKLRQLWKLIFQVCRVGEENQAPAANVPQTTTTISAPPAEEEKKKSRMTSLWSRSSKANKSESDAASTTSSTAPTTAADGAPVNIQLSLGSKDGEADKYGQTKHFYETLQSYPPSAIRDTIWSMVKHDHPDALVLRFLRARKWDVEKALIMLVSTMAWRAKEMDVDGDIMKNGELEAVEKNDGISKDFLAQIRKGISYVHGCDKQGRPLCFVNVRLHKAGEQSEESLERYTVYLIETCRMLLRGGVDTAVSFFRKLETRGMGFKGGGGGLHADDEGDQTIVFDMTGFSMANMDYTPVKFMIKCFEANYPECLGTVLVHKAPWIFQGIWKVIRGWLDPVVANKVHFTNNATEMQEYIPLKHIPKDLDGQEDWSYKYVEPVTGENDKMKDTATRDELLRQRAELYKQYEEATMEWIKTADAGVKKRREEIADKMREDYWRVDPYIRARSYYDRTGVLLPGGEVDWYPGEKKNGEVKKEAVTSPDDLD
ncbi:phosphatidylinositol transfer protein csr1 [Podospora pseudopauciseta]|uniref:Phosphatidylinositol transfer protein csr1 n=1 Tax=Podospora pseudopauciseta TaxID=2093780 RepID=A0ABR0HAC0_9PEZI|nr:phosphatidylinositol transfer protein csr1 [Podospora pseudopauciseta]